MIDAAVLPSPRCRRPHHATSTPVQSARARSNARAGPTGSYAELRLPPFKAEKAEGHRGVVWGDGDAAVPLWASGDHSTPSIDKTPFLSSVRGVYCSGNGARALGDSPPASPSILLLVVPAGLHISIILGVMIIIWRDPSENSKQNHGEG